MGQGGGSSGGGGAGGGMVPGGRFLVLGMGGDLGQKSRYFA